MKNFLFINFIFLFSFSFSQVYNTSQTYYNEFQIFKIDSLHTNIKPYDADTLPNNLILVKPHIYSENYINPTNKKIYYDNLCGIDITAKKNKFLFTGSLYTGITQHLPVSPITDTLPVIPSVGLPLKTFDKTNLYSNFLGGISYKPTNYLKFEIGNKKTFFGDGYRSLFLSDYSPPYPYFKTTVETWKVKYVYMIARQKDYDSRYSKTLGDMYPKWTFTHYLSFNLFRGFNFSMFETVVTSPYDSLGAKRGLDFNYLNPVIFFRSVEMSLGSPDNVLVGFSGHLKFLKTTMIYGQIFIDEFIYSHIASSKEYWDEKYGIQAGIKSYKTLGIKNLYTQIELNAVRPFTYSHLNPVRSYTHDLMPLAHPLGANFVEFVGILSYIHKNLFFLFKTTASEYGDDSDTNFGHNPLLSYETRNSDEDVFWLQGQKTKYLNLQITAGIKKYNNIFSLKIIYSKRNGQYSQNNIFAGITIGKPLFSKYYDY